MKQAIKMKCLLCVSIVLILLVSLLVVPVDASNLETGRLGDNITYTFDPKQGRVEVTGTGEMWDFDPSDMSAPELKWGSTTVTWESTGRVSPLAGNRNVRHVVISDGITRIGSCAFYHCGIQDIAFGSDVSEIGQLAFAGHSITYLQFPASLKLLDALCFYSESAICPVYFLGDAPEIVTIDHIPVWPFFAGDPKSGDTIFYYTPGAKGWPIENLIREKQEPYVQLEMPYFDVENRLQFYSIANCNWLMGTGDGRFMPDRTATRAEFVTALYRMKNASASDIGKPFFDVEEGLWYTDAVNWAAAKRVVKGYPFFRFCPNDPVTREQLVTMFWRAEGEPAADPDVLSDCFDAEQISPWAEDAFAWAVSAGLIQGEPGTILAPKGTITRAQLAQILMNYDQLKN